MNPQQPIKYNQPTAAPTPKVASAGVGGVVATILIFLAREFTHIELTPEVAAAIATLIAFGSAYWKRDQKPPAAVEIITEDKPEETTFFRG